MARLIIGVPTTRRGSVTSQKTAKVKDAISQLLHLQIPAMETAIGWYEHLQQLSRESLTKTLDGHAHGTHGSLGLSFG